MMKKMVIMNEKTKWNNEDNQRKIIMNNNEIIMKRQWKY